MGRQQIQEELAKAKNDHEMATKQLHSQVTELSTKLQQTENEYKRIKHELETNAENYQNKIKQLDYIINKLFSFMQNIQQ